MQDQTTPHTISAVVGRHVFTAGGAYVGDIVELLFEIELGQVRFAVVMPGGPFGVESRWLCVPFQALRYSAEHDCFVLRQDPSMLNAPPVDDDVRRRVLCGRPAFAQVRPSTESVGSSAMSLRRKAANAE